MGRYVSKLGRYVDMFTSLYVRSAYIWTYILSLLQKHMIEITYHDLIKSYYIVITFPCYSFSLLEDSTIQTCQAVHKELIYKGTIKVSGQNLPLREEKG